MPLKIAFSGTNGTWFLNLDLVPATPIIRSQPEIDRVISQSGGQPQNVLQTGHDAIGLSPSKLNDELPSKLDRRSDLGGSEIKMVIETDDVVRSNNQKKKEGAVDHGNVRVETNVDALLVSKMERSRKMHKSEHTSGDKIKQKMEKNQSYDEPVKDQITGQNLGSGEYSKVMTQLEQRDDPNMVALERFPSKPSHIDSSVQQAPIVDKQKKKKRRLSENDGASQDEPLNNILNRNNAAPLEQQAGKDSHSERLVSDHDHTNIEKELDVVTEDITQKVLGGGSAEIGPSKQSNDADICKEGSKHRKKKKKKSSKHSSLAQADSEVPANFCSSRKRSKTEEGTSIKSNAVDSPSNGKSIEASGNNRDKLNNFCDMDMTDADLGSEHAAKSGSPSKSLVSKSQSIAEKRKEKKGNCPRLRLTHKKKSEKRRCQ